MHCGPGKGYIETKLFSMKNSYVCDCYMYLLWLKMIFQYHNILTRRKIYEKIMCFSFEFQIQEVYFLMKIKLLRRVYTCFKYCVLWLNLNLKHSLDVYGHHWRKWDLIWTSSFTNKMKIFFQVSTLTFSDFSYFLGLWTLISPILLNLVLST